MILILIAFPTMILSFCTSSLWRDELHQRLRNFKTTNASKHYPLQYIGAETRKDRQGDPRHFHVFSFDRRLLIKKTIAPSVSLLPLVRPSNSNAAQTAGEAVRRSAANIPGYGQPDVFYPSSFVGKWRATRVVVYSDDVIFDKLSITMPFTMFYDVRFITVDGDGRDVKGGEKVIADRGFNEASYYNALKAEIGAQKQSQSAALTLPTIRTVSWSQFNPNVCTIHYNDSSTKEIKVTKRAADLDESAGIISSSEYCRITTTSGAMGIPSISASRVMTKWKTSDITSGNDGKQVVEGIEVVYSDGTMRADPMSMEAGGGAAKLQVSSKSRLRLVKRSIDQETSVLEMKIR